MKIEFKDIFLNYNSHLHMFAYYNNLPLYLKAIKKDDEYVFFEILEFDRENHYVYIEWEDDQNIDFSKDFMGLSYIEMRPLLNVDEIRTITKEIFGDKITLDNSVSILDNLYKNGLCTGPEYTYEIDNEDGLYITKLYVKSINPNVMVKVKNKSKTDSKNLAALYYLVQFFFLDGETPFPFEDENYELTYLSDNHYDENISGIFSFVHDKEADKIKIIYNNKGVMLEDAFTKDVREHYTFIEDSIEKLSIELEKEKYKIYVEDIKKEWIKNNSEE